MSQKVEEVKEDIAKIQQALIDINNNFNEVHLNTATGKYISNIMRDLLNNIGNVLTVYEDNKKEPSN